MLGRLLEHLTQMERSAQAARAIVQIAVNEIDANRSQRLPVARDMIIAVMRAAGNVGLSRSDIIAAIKRDYGVDIPPNTVTGTLLRMQRAGLARQPGYVEWFLK